MLESIESPSALPQNVEAERAVLGAVLIDNLALAVITPILKDSDFFLDTHRRIWTAVGELAARSAPIDLVTVRDEIDRMGAIDRVGGPAYLASLVDGIPDVANAEHYARIVKEKSTLRRLISLGQKITRDGAGADRAADDVIGDAASEIFDIAQDSARGGFVPLGEIAEHNLTVLEEARGRQGMLTGLPTGFRDLDRLTSGLQASELIVLAARPSVGKTSFALNIAQHVAVREARSVGFFSLEMAKEALGLRVLCSEAEVNAKKVRDGFGSDDDFRRLVLAQTKIAGARFFIDDTSALAVPEMRAKCQRLKREHGLDLVVVDYMQLMAGHGRIENRTQEVSQISRGLKLLAKDLRVPVIALSQLSRQSERRTGEQKKPQLADLRDSGSIEQDADVVIFLYREEMYDRETERKNLADVIIAKQRNGPTDEFEMVFLHEQTTFRTYERFAEPPL
jgi:replicative DNA helicase